MENAHRWAVVLANTGKTVKIYDDKSDAAKEAARRTMTTGNVYIVEARKQKQKRTPMSKEEKASRQREAMRKYEEKTIQVNFRVNPETEAIIYNRLKEVENKSGYIKNMIRLDALRKQYRDHESKVKARMAEGAENG